MARKEKDVEKEKDTNAAAAEEEELNERWPVREDIEKRKDKTKKFDWFDCVLDEERQSEKDENEEMRKKEKEKVDSKRMEDERVEKRKKKKMGMKKLRSWFGDESSEEEISSDDSEDNNEWDKIERKKRNKDKKKRRKEAKDNIIAVTLEKTNHIIGLGPIPDEALTKHKDFKKAKMEAVREFLKDNLMFDDEELDEMDIKETVLSAAKDGVIYVGFDKKEDIHEIRMRIAESQNNAIIARNFIPPQIFERYMYVSNMCKLLRVKDDTLRTQVRFGATDVEVLFKTRGSKEPYRQQSLASLTNTDDIPKFNFEKKWKQRQDRPPRTNVFLKAGRAGPGENPAKEKQNLTPPSRENSIELRPNKKSRNERSVSSEVMEQDNDPLDISNTVAGAADQSL